MRRPTKALAVGALVACATAGLATGALGLWASSSAVTAAPVRLGDVSFGASAGTDAGADGERYSQQGEPVTLTLPGSAIAAVLDARGPDPAPVIWRFTAQGYARGIAGLAVDVVPVAQVGPGGVVADLGAGVGATGTVLARSTVVVYPAATNGDCSAVPAIGSGDPGRNVYLQDAGDRELQAAGGYAGGPVRQGWCVAMTLKDTPDGSYVNEGRAAGTAADGVRHVVFDRWSAGVEFPSSGTANAYRSRGDVAGTARNGTRSRDSALFEADVLPDPGAEPDVTIRLTPKVTSLRR